MKQYIAATALCLMAVSPIFAQTKRVMTVTTKDGNQVVYKVNNVQNVAFKEYDAYKELGRNQMAFKGEAVKISKVTLLQSEGNNIFSLYAEEKEAETRAAATPMLKITLPETLMGTTIELGSDKAEGVKVEYNGEEMQLNGTLEAKISKSQATITLKSETADYTDLVCRCVQAYTQIYEATNSINVTNVNQSADFNIASALVLEPKETGAATTFAFSDVVTTDAKGMLAGKIGVSVSIAASKLYAGTIDMAADAASYSFKYIDYETSIIYEKVKSGTITTAKDNDGKLYIKIDATMDDNRTVKLEYYGATAKVESLDDMKPAPVVNNGFKYYNADGKVDGNKTLGTCYVKEYKGNFTFHFVPEGEGKSSSEKVELKVSESLINIGEIDLATLAAKDTPHTFNLKYNKGSIQLCSYKEGHGYGLSPTIGTMTITKDEAGVYEFSLDVTNKYIKQNEPDKPATGDNTRLVLYYKGTFDKY